MPLAHDSYRATVAESLWLRPTENALGLTGLLAKMRHASMGSVSSAGRTSDGSQPARLSARCVKVLAGDGVPLLHAVSLPDPSVGGTSTLVHLHA